MCKFQNPAIAHRALARGILSGKYKDLKKIPKNSRAYKSIRVRKLLNTGIIKLLNDLNKIAKKNERSLVELALAWQFNNTIKCSSVVGARNIKQLDTIIKSSNMKINKEIYNDINRCIEFNGFKDYVNNMPEVFLEK